MSDLAINKTLAYPAFAAQALATQGCFPSTYQVYYMRGLGQHQAHP